MSQLINNNSNSRWLRCCSLLALLLVLLIQNIESFSFLVNNRQQLYQKQQLKQKQNQRVPVAVAFSGQNHQQENPIDINDNTDYIQNDLSSNTNTNRRNILMNTLFVTTSIGLSLVTTQVEPAIASGGATAGKYTTIPIAKRRYYGRVQQAVHEFLIMGPDIVKGDMTQTTIQSFFDITGVVIIPSKQYGNECVKKANGQCKGAEVRDSRYNDMKTSMYLLGNAFRTDQQKPPDRLPTVKAARAFFKQMDEMEKRVTKKTKLKDVDSQQLYVAAYNILDEYLDLVELPPISSGHYDKEFDTLVGETARIT